MGTRAFVRSVILASLMMWGVGEANAGLFRTYLSVNGSDANACTLPSPCRLLPAALAAVNDGGEIWMLDSANFNTTRVVIAKSVTILAVPGALGSVVADVVADPDGGFVAIHINSPGVHVTLRNVVILNLAGAGNTGIWFTQGTGLTLEGCEIYGMGLGVFANVAGATVTIKDTTIRDNSGAGVSMTGASKLQLLNSSLLNNFQQGVLVRDGARAVIAGGAISGSVIGVYVIASGSTTTQLAISGSAVTANSTGLRVEANGGGDTAAAMINKTTFTQNSTGVVISGATATVYTLTNNTFKYNGSDVLGSLTPLAAQ